MDINLSYAISNEDLEGVLRTILLFLESIGFKTTSTVLQKECSSKGYPEVVSAPAKIVIVHPSTVEVSSTISQQSDQGNQTEFVVDVPKHDEDDRTRLDTSSDIDPLYMYDTDLSNKSLNENGIDRYSTHVMVSENIYLARPCRCCNCSEILTTDDDTNKQILQETTERLRMTPGDNKQVRNLSSKRSPNTIESEVPTKIISQSCSKNLSKQGYRHKHGYLRKTHSNPTLKTNSKTVQIADNGGAGTHPEGSAHIFTQESNTNCKELRKRFRQLQNEHQKLMGVTTELTIALQTHILGQSENLNSMLNHCRTIYPDLFKSELKHINCDTKCNSKKSTENINEQSSATNVAYSNSELQNSIKVKVISNINVQDTPSTNTISNSAKTRRLSDNFSRPSSPDKTSPKATLVTEEILTTDVPDTRKILPQDDVGFLLKENGIQKVKTKEIDLSKLTLSSKTSKGTETSQNVANLSSNISVTNDKNNVDKIKTEKYNDSSSSNEQTEHYKDVCKNSLTSNKTENKVEINNLLTSEEKRKQKISSDSSKSHKVIVEVKNVISEDSSYTSIVVPQLTQLQTSSFVLVTATEGAPTMSSKSLQRQLSSKSCDEYLLVNTAKEKTSFGISSEYARKNPESKKNVSSESVQGHEAALTPNSTVELLNNEGETLLLDNDEHNEPPEIFVTTENLAKAQYEYKCIFNRTSAGNTYFDLDFRKMKKDMLNGDDNLKLPLIQALRWRITRSDRGVRDQVISSYIRHDLLGLHSTPNTCGQSTMELYYCPNKETPHPLQTGMARLVNAFASLTLGRDYLCQDDDLLVSLLVPLIIGTHYSQVNLDDITRDMLMATLQKLSLRNRQRICMITAGLVEYLVSFLGTNHNIISEYCMEYSTALLMNLCLHREARERLHPVAKDVVSLLANLLGDKYQYCMPYVNGAMYSLLSDPYINQEAQRLNLAELIEYHIKRSNKETRMQLQFILKLHLEGSNEMSCACDPNIEPENEVDLLEPELDIGDFIELQPLGEELLENYKLLFPAYGSHVYDVHMQRLCRPITPIPRPLNSAEAIDNIENHQTDKTEQIHQNEIIHDTTGQKKVTPQKNVSDKCTCIEDKLTSPDELNGLNNSPKSFLEKPAPFSNKRKVNDERSSAKSKRESLVSEPTSSLQDGSKKDAKKMSSYPQSNSPDMTFCEETQQFYYTPSVKTGIFESQKTKKLHRVPPSFTRIIPLPARMSPSHTACCNPHCGHPYSKSTPVTPKENSSARNPPYAINYTDRYATCYRENYTNPNIANFNSTPCNCKCGNMCSACNKRSKYMCNCYKVIKSYIDEFSQNNIEDNNHIFNKSAHNNGTKDQNTALSTMCLNCQKSQDITRNESVVHKHKSSGSDLNTNSAIVNFSYEELVTATADVRDHVCPNAGADCKCYDVVFQSRPKILRTPPN